MAGTWTCSEDEDFGSLGDNKVIVIGGTSGTPADFASFVTADRAGEAVLLGATAGLSPTLALTYQIRPVDVIALLISFIVASKTTEADYIFITGTDWRDAAQTESIDVSAGNGTYVSTKYFRTITNIDCSDNSAGGGTQWADGTVRATQPQWGVIWDYGDGQYKVDCDFNIGDGSTSTYFQSKDEMVSFKNDSSDISVLASATLTLGELVGSYGSRGSYWSVGGTDDGLMFLLPLAAAGTFNMYDSTIHVRQNCLIYFRNGTFTAKNSTLSHIESDGYNWRNGFVFDQSVTSNFDRVFINDVLNFYFFVAPASITNVHVHRINQGVNTQVTVTLPNILVTSYTTADLSSVGAVTMTVVDPEWHPSLVSNSHASGVIAEQYTCNIHVVDKDGAILQGVVVDCEDTDTNAVWTAGTVTTDASGDITEQNITYKTWTGTSETLKDYSPHKFTLSKAGYETLVLENITVDGPIDWHLELQTLNKLFGTSDIVKVCGVG